jgi:uncharacterized protein YbjT (DUF2867 family)
MADKKIIAVMGATGAQGSGLVNAILNDPDGGFTARAITRNTDSDKAKELAAKGVEVVHGNLEDPESIKRAFEGAYGAFCITFFWEHYSPEKELAHAKIMADAARDANLKHVIWSSLEDTRKWMSLDDNRMPTLLEKFKVPHLDAKGEADKFFQESGVPATILITSFYWDNLIYFGLNPKKDNGRYALTIPMGDKKLPGIASEDIGKIAYGIFKSGDEFKGKTVGIAGEFLTINEMTDKMSSAMGKEIYYNKVSFDTFRSFGFPGADDVGNMFQFKHDFNDDFLKARDIGLSRKLNPSLQTFDVWLEKNKDKIPLE